MEIMRMVKNRTTKDIHVAKVVDADTDNDVLGFAMAYAGEDRTSVFGWRVYREPETNEAIVILHTD